MSRLQELAQKRNSSKGRIKGLRNNIRGMIKGKTPYLTEEEESKLARCEVELDILLQGWDKHWELIKENL